LPLNQSLPLPVQLKKSETLLMIILNPQKNQDLQTSFKSLWHLEPDQKCVTSLFMTLLMTRSIQLYPKQKISRLMEY